MELKVYMKFGPQRAMITFFFSNTVIGWSFGVCLGAEELEQWYGDRQDFLANLPTIGEEIDHVLGNQGENRTTQSCHE